ncbi:hypothetical protein J6590_015048 [Homalodisca vitripennis]|nr:hypothetical protein J6590_015048 [Homalodisca vitripennis]
MVPQRIHKPTGLSMSRVFTIPYCPRRRGRYGCTPVVVSLEAPSSSTSFTVDPAEDLSNFEGGYSDKSLFAAISEGICLSESITAPEAPPQTADYNGYLIPILPRILELLFELLLKSSHFSGCDGNTGYGCGSGGYSCGHGGGGSCGNCGKNSINCNCDISESNGFIYK